MSKRRVPPWLLFWGIVLSDQLLKIAVQTLMHLRQSIPVWPGVFHITYVQNIGAAFGMLGGARYFFIAAGVLLLLFVGLIYPRLRRRSAWLHYGVIALVGGTLGNLIDRIYNGAVIDYLDFRVWPVFNLADIAIVVGTFAIVYASLFVNNADAQRIKRS